MVFALASAACATRAATATIDPVPPVVARPKVEPAVRPTVAAPRIPRVDPADPPTNLPRDREEEDAAALREECVASGGDWLPAPGWPGGECHDVMPDAGKRCGSQDDCEGVCVFVARLPASPTEDRIVGRCSRHAWVSACKPIVLPDVRGRVPRGAPAYLHLLCP